MTLKEAYKTLDVKDSYSFDDIKQSYRRAVRLYHPDVQSGLSDPEKFHRIVSAYNVITQEWKEQNRPTSGKHGPGGSDGGSWGKRFARSTSSYFKNFMGAEPKNGPETKQNPNSNGYHRRKARSSGSSVSFDELVKRFDRSADVWIQIESARTMFKQAPNTFERFAMSRLKRSRDTVQVELIRLLGATGSLSALTAIAPYLTSRNRESLLAAFVALDKAGNAGYTIIDRYLNPPSALTYQLTGFFRRSGFEQKLLQERLIPPHKLRRLLALRRRTGVPLRDLLEGIGVIIPRSV